VTTNKVHWGLEREIIDFEEVYQKLAGELKKNMNPIRDYMSENSLGI